MDGGIKMIKDPRTFKRDDDWYNEGYEFLCWLNKFNRTYLVGNGDVTLVMFDEGNGHCHFVEFYHPEKNEVLAATYQLEDMMDTLASDLKQDYQLYSPAEGAGDLFYQVRHYINQYDQPIYKVITLSIREDEQWPGHELFGWYHNMNDAYKAVETNACDMQDCAFNYVLVSKSYQGGYGLRDHECAWYKWDYEEKKWKVCGRPEICHGMQFV